MEKIQVLVVALSIFTASAALLRQSEDDIHKRIERSSCDNCDDHGPPFPPTSHVPLPPSPPPPPLLPLLPPPPPPPPSPPLPLSPPAPDFFRARQWSGVAREGHHHGVLNGASAAIGGGSGRDAFSFASTVDNAPILAFDDYGFGGQPNTGDSVRNSQASNSFPTSGVDLSSSPYSQSSSSSGSSRQSAAQSNDEAINSFGYQDKSDYGTLGGSKSHGEIKYNMIESTQNSNLDDKGHIKSQPSNHEFGNGGKYSLEHRNLAKFSSKQYPAGFAGSGQQSDGFGGSPNNSSDLSNSQEQSSGNVKGPQQPSDFGDIQRSKDSQKDSIEVNSIGQQPNNFENGQQEAETFKSSSKIGFQSITKHDSNIKSHFSQTSSNFENRGHGQLSREEDIARPNLQFSSSSQPASFGGSSFNTQPSNNADFNAQSSVQRSSIYEDQKRGDTGKFEEPEPPSKSNFVNQELQPSQSGNLNDKGDLKTHSNSHGFSDLLSSGYTKNSAGFSDDQQQSVEFGGSAPLSGLFRNIHQQSSEFVDQQSGGFGSGHQVTDLSSRRQIPDRLANVQQQAKGFAGTKQQFPDGLQKSVGFDSAGQRSRKFENGEQNPGGFDINKQTASQNTAEYGNSLGRAYYYKPQDSLKDALNLASQGAFNLAQGLYAAAQNGCSCSDKTNYALGYAKKTEEKS